MTISQLLQDGLLFLDGGMGTLLQAKGLFPGELPETWNLKRPDVITEIHRAYYDAGCHIVSTNTFGANLLKFSHEDLQKIIAAAVSCARAAQEKLVPEQDRFIALDIGPTGKLLKPFGDLDFEEAVRIFSETVRIGVKCGVDLILIETMNDSLETKAAVIAAKENCDLPVFVSNAYQSDGKLMTGSSPEAMAAMLEGLGADAIGANCSLGPQELLPIAQKLVSATDIPILLKPNAGLPEVSDNATVYPVGPEEFSSFLAQAVQKGVRIVGGCCGTTPEYLSVLIKELSSIPCPKTETKRRAVVSSYSHAVYFDEKPILIGERINPTGKKRLKEALIQGDIDFILSEAVRQKESGVDLIDVNVGLPEIDEKAMLKNCVTQLQAVLDLPLQIDTADPLALEAAMRVYNGKPMINSVNGKKESMETVFPLVKRYGGLVVALTLDENGIPETAEKRVEIARRILETARRYGLSEKDLIFDPLAMTVSADSRSAQITLEAISRIRNELGCLTSLGVSNVSFGLPNRDAINAAFFAIALERGLNAAIMNPFSRDMMKNYYSFCALKGLDPNFEAFIAFSEAESEGKKKDTVPEKTVHCLADAILLGFREQAAELTQEFLNTTEPMEIIHSQIIPSLQRAGERFERKEMYLPQLLMSAEAAKEAMERVKEKLVRHGGEGKHGKATFVLATVKGDIHDIGKNIVKLLMENFGYDVIDLGKDVPEEEIVRAALENKAELVGLSALMTTTVPAMERTIRMLREAIPSCKIVVGGAVLTKEYADAIGADHYAADAMECVRYAETLF